MSDRIDLGELERLYNEAAGGDYWPDEQAKAEVVTALPGLLAWIRDAREAILVELAGTDDDGPKRTANMEALLARIAAPEVPHG